jgi:hypothetical protein
MQMADIQSGMNGGMMWEPTGEEDGEGEFDQFSLGDGVSRFTEVSARNVLMNQSHHPFMPQKRLPYDPSLMAPSSSHGIMSNQGLNGSHSNGASPPKKPRLQSSRPSQPLHGNHSQLYAMTMPQSPTYNTQSGLLDPAVLTPGHPTSQHPHIQQQQHPHQLHQNHQHQPRQHGLPNHAQAPPHNLMMNNQPQSQVQTPNPSPLQSTHPGTSTLPARQQQQPLHATASTDTDLSSNSNPNPNSNHRLPESHHSLSHAHAQPQSHHQSQRPNQPHNPTQNQIQNQNQNQNHNLNVNNPTLTPNHHPNAMTNANSNPNPHTPVSMTTERGYQPSPQLAPEIQQAGLSDAQRRTQALLQLQQEQGMRDDELVEVITEFQDSIAAVDTYLAIQKDALRRMWLTNVIQQRRRQAA